MSRKRIFTLIMLLVLAVIAVRFLPGCGEGLDILTNGSGGSATEEWDDWSYRRSVTVNNSGAAVTDYQVNVALDGTFDYGKALPGGSDIRFNYNGTSLSYWIENWNDAGNSSIWVKVPSLPNGDTVIYLYYGNADQTAVSNFDNTFTKNSGLTGLAAQWHMDEGSGTVISDSSGNGNTGTISGAAWTGTDGGGWYDRSDAGFSAGDSLGFDGVNDYVTVADHNSLDVGSITIAAWVRTGIDVAATQYIIGKWNEGANQRSYALLIESSAIYFLTSQSGTLATVDSQGRGSLSANAWYHVAVTSGGADKRIFINGIQAGLSWVWTYTIHPGTSILTIGSRDGTPVDLFSGIIDEVSIYNRALSADEIMALSQRRKYSSGVGTPALGAEEIVP